MLKVGSVLKFTDEFFNSFVSYERNRIKGRDAIITRIFTSPSWGHNAERVELEFIAPTSRHRIQFRSYDKVRVERWVESGEAIVQ